MGPRKGEGDDVEKKQAAVLLSALSHHLLTALVNDRTLLESITKASRPTASSSSFVDIDDDSNSPRRLPDRSSSSSGGSDVKKICISHAKTVVGRGLTSGV